MAYFGFPAFGMHDGAATAVAGGSVGTVKAFKVDGTFGAEEESALRAFYGATHYNQYWAVLETNTSSGSNGFQTTANNNDAKTAVPGLINADTNLGWLNAFNAPHWINIYESFNVPYGGNTANFSDGQQRKEIYSTSWTRDLIKAWEVSKPQQGLTTGRLQINGLTDPTYAFTPHNRGGHSVGMGLDLGFGQQYILAPNQTSTTHVTFRH